MKNRMMKYVLVIAITMMAGINVFNAQKTDGLSDVALLNVEALAQYEDGEGDKYCTIHIKCFNGKGEATGYYMADSYKGLTCTYLTSHEHSCTSCNSR